MPVLSKTIFVTTAVLLGCAGEYPPPAQPTAEVRPADGSAVGQSTPPDSQEQLSLGQKPLQHASAEQSAQSHMTFARLDQADEQQALLNSELNTKRVPRTAAERSAAYSAAEVAKFATIKQEPRGMVITFIGSVLFESSSSDMLLEAQVKLNTVADVLAQQDPDSKLIVESYTDALGGASYNQQLSQRRAQTVRDYLVSRGIAADRLTAQGYGSSQAVAGDDSPESRSHNRRIEIIVEPASARAH